MGKRLARLCESVCDGSYVWAFMCQRVNGNVHLFVSVRAYLALLFLLHIIMTVFNRRVSGAFYEGMCFLVQIGRYERT